MTENEMELMNLIHENDNPEKALTTAVDVILLYLTLHGSSESQASADLQALA